MMPAHRRARSATVLREEDLAPQIVSWGVALTVATVWLTVVHLTPLPVAAPAATVAGPVPIAVLTDDHASAPTPGTNNSSALVLPHTPVKTTRAVAAEAKLASIFAADLAEHVVANVAKLIPGVQTARTPGDAKGRSGKTALESGGADQRPSMGFAGSSLSAGKASAVGSVERTVAIDRANFRAQQLPIVIASSLENATADATELGAFVRGRVAQLQNCYERAGGTDLAGVVALRLTIGAGGTVRTAEIVRRTWSGPGAADAEACLIRMARGWHVAAALEGATVTLPISFTRGG